MFSDSILIAATPEELFDLTQDYDRRLEWDPFLVSAELLDGVLGAGVGVQAKCVDRHGFAMTTEYVSFNQPTACAVRMIAGPWFIGEFAGAWRFVREKEMTRVSFRYHLVTKPIALSWLLGPIVRAVFQREMRKRLLALSEFAADSQAINEVKSR